MAGAQPWGNPGSTTGNLKLFLSEINSAEAEYANNSLVVSRQNEPITSIHSETKLS